VKVADYEYLGSLFVLRAMVQKTGHIRYKWQSKALEGEREDGEKAVQ
jgi:hypothetical protein